MLSYEDAVLRGVDACVDKLGRDYVEAHSDKLGFSFGQSGDGIQCKVIVHDESEEDMGLEEMLRRHAAGLPLFNHQVACQVSYETGKVTFVNGDAPIRPLTGAAARRKRPTSRQDSALSAKLREIYT